MEVAAAVAVRIGLGLEEGTGPGEAAHTVLVLGEGIGLEVGHRTGPDLEVGIGLAEERHTVPEVVAVRSPAVVGLRTDRQVEHRSRRVLGWSSRPLSRSYGRWHREAA